MNELLTKKAHDSERFNSQNFVLNDSDAFIQYFIQILGIASKHLGLISDIVAESIMNNCLKAITIRADEKLVHISNLLYMFSWYLNQFEPYAAFEKLAMIENVGQADLLFDEAEKAFFKEIQKAQITLKSNEKKIRQLGDDKILKFYVFLSNELVSFKSIDSDNINFKEKHSLITGGDYIFLGNEIQECNYFSRIFTAVRRFIIEVNIALKINGPQLISWLKKLGDNEKIQNENLEKDIEKKYQKKISELKSEINPTTASSMKIFNEKKDNILSKMDKEIEKLHKKLEEQSYDTCSATFEFPSLGELLKNYALFYKCSQGVLKYPTSIRQKGRMLNNISLNEACDIIVSHFDLSPSEMDYLKRFSVDI